MRRPFVNPGVEVCTAAARGRRPTCRYKPLEMLTFFAESLGERKWCSFAPPFAREVTTETAARDPPYGASVSMARCVVLRTPLGAMAGGVMVPHEPCEPA